MATVYEAEHVALGKRTALKRMHPHLAIDAKAASRFLREGKAATQVRSPHVVEVFDVGVQDGVPYLVMELLEGVDLAGLLRRRRRIPCRELVDLMLPVASAICAAHDAGVVHRDLKPSNVFLTHRDGRLLPTILDFGISKLTGDFERDPTASEVLLGTVHYMSPEQTRGGNRASARSDQYALGVVLYECATGVKPFAGASPYAVMHAIVSSQPAAPSSLEPDLPPEFDEVVSRAMHRDPERRFPTVLDFGVALLPMASENTRERYAREFGVATWDDRGRGGSDGASSSSSTLEMAPSAASRRTASNGRWLAVTVAVVACLLVLGISARPASHGSRPEATIEPTVRSPVHSPRVTAPATAPAVRDVGPPQPVRDDVTAFATIPTAASPAGVGSSTAPPLRHVHLEAAASVDRVNSSASIASSRRASPERGTNGAFIVE